MSAIVEAAKSETSTKVFHWVTRTLVAGLATLAAGALVDKAFEKSLTNGKPEEAPES